MKTPLIALLALSLSLPALAQKPTQIAQGPTEAPYSLTTPDGTGLALVGLDARAVVDGPLAFTELRLTFENPHDRTIEGHFQITMPDDAAISRFAMKIGGAWMEGEVVEKQAARRAYEDALHRRQDPALLESDGGNLFRARVFPIRPRENKELIISWSHELTRAGEAYRLPLAGLPAIRELSLTAMTVTTGAGGVQTSLGGSSGRYQITKVDKKDFAPDQDWIVFGGEIPATGDALRQDNLAVVRFTAPAIPGGADATFPEAVVLFDTSASRVIGYDNRLEALATLVRRLAELGAARVTVVAFDQTAERVYEGAPADFGKAALDRLRARGALGASSLDVGLEALALTEGKNRRAIILTDGVVTAGESDRGALGKRVSALAGRGFMRVDAIVDTTARDSDVLAALVSADGLRPGKVIEGKSPLDDQLARLRRATLDDVTLAVDGAQWVWPDRVRGLQPGDAVVAFVDVPPGAPLQVRLGGGASGTVQPAVREAEKPLLERAWVKARIERLENLRSQSDPDLKEALKQQIITLSTRHRVLSTYTALVVLETENDYRRFNIDRRALADILTVGPTGLELMQRKDLAVAVAPRRRPHAPPAAAAQGHAPPRQRGPERGRAGLARRQRRPEHCQRRRARRRRRRRRRRHARQRRRRDRRRPLARRDGRRPRRPPAEPMAEAEADEAPMREEAKSSVALEAPPPPPPAAPAPARGDALLRDEERSEDRRLARRPARVATSESRPRPPSRPDPFPRNRGRQQVAVEPTGESEGRRELREIEKAAPALIGEMAEIDAALDRGKAKTALDKAQAWRNKDATDLLALVALGRSYTQTGDGLQAARAFGSVLDLYPSRADMRRFAGNWLERLGRPGLEIAADTYANAMAQRPDHPSIYHLLGMTLLRLGRYEEALTTVLDGIGAQRIGGRFAAVERILAEDAQLIAAAWAAAEPARRAEIEQRLSSRGLRIDDRASMRFVLTWETDANDVDFHIFDGKYNHAYYSRRALASGGELYADITTGYGPECFTIYDPQAFPYRLKAHYYSRGPMGHGAGKVQIIRHDGKGGIGIEDRPFVIMQDGAYVDLGTVNAKDAVPQKPATKVAK
ncbi:MAG: VIT domain-containing protein [bacterium]